VAREGITSNPTNTADAAATAMASTTSPTAFVSMFVIPEYDKLITTIMLYSTAANIPIIFADPAAAADRTYTITAKPNRDSKHVAVM
jgi:hypothetical protein